MAKYNFTIRLFQRNTIPLFILGISAVFLVAVPANAQRQSRSSTSFNDRLFKPQVYAQLENKEDVEGSLIDPQYAGQQLSRDQVTAIALEQFIKAAAGQGISEKEITKAIFEGRFNPDFEDLLLAWEGLGNPPASQRPSDYRDKLWNQHFGAIAGIGIVRTIINGQEVTRSAKDLLLRLVMNVNFRHFPGAYGRDPDASLTYDQMIVHLERNHPAQVNRLNNQIEVYGDIYSAYSYFNFKLVGNDCCPGLQLHKDYDELRAHYQNPSVQKALAKTDSPPLTTSRRDSTRKIPAAPDATKKPSGQPKISVKATCDDLATHPEDKGRIGAGVVDEKIIPSLAIEKCSQAVRQNPKVARFHFQLGRAYWATKRYDEALDAFLKAEEMEYAPAYFYLGQAYEQGLIEGEKADPAAAQNLYMIAASEGFEPAVRAYQEVTASDAYEPDFSDFKQPILLRALYEGNLEVLNRNHSETLCYIGGIYAFLRMERESFPPDAYDPTCSQQIDSDVVKQLQRSAYVELYGLSPDASQIEFMKFLYSKGFDIKFLAQLKKWERVILNGTDDFYLFTYDYGTCEGKATKKVQATIKRFLMEGPAAKPRSGN